MLEDGVEMAGIRNPTVNVIPHEFRATTITHDELIVTLPSWGRASMRQGCVFVDGELKS
jgi:hypothetical protein